MTDKEWLAEVARRIAQNEGCALQMYHDKYGIPTIAIGYNLQRDHAADDLRAVGVADPGEVIAGRDSITQQQAEALFERDLPNYVNAARASLSPGVFDRLSDARRFVIVDICYNMGPGVGGWADFVPTHDLLRQAVAKYPWPSEAHVLFSQAADHLAASKWAREDVPGRAAKDIAMMRLSTWVE